MWFYFAVSASMLWGLVYVIDEQLYKHISVPTSLAITSFFACIAMTAIALFHGEMANDLKTIFASRQVFYLMTALTIVFVAAEFCIGFSISGKNAAVAAMVEISYPLFTVIFGLLLFKSAVPNMLTIIGAIFVGAGVTLISMANK